MEGLADGTTMLIKSSYIGSNGCHLGLMGFVAAIAFSVDGSYVLCGVSVAVAMINQLLAYMFWAFARDEARFRVFAQATREPSPKVGRQGLTNLRSFTSNPERLASIERIEEADMLEENPAFVDLRGLFQHNPSLLYDSSEVLGQLDIIPISITRRDAQAVPDSWIVTFTFIGNLIGFVLLVWGVIAAIL